MHERTDDLTKMKNPAWWPCIGLLPIKRRDKLGYQCAMLLHDVDTGSYNFVNKLLGSVILTSDMVPTTPEALIADGWIVD